jgi:peptidoglycan/xylan/chitin deacetylase (PgdA/CDA1 family)
MYHRVLPDADAARDAVEPGMYVRPETFARHLDWLESYFCVLPLHEIVSRLAERRPLPPGACALTFDDGWRDNHDFALPELERRGLPATIFVVTDRVGTEGAFWPDEAGRRMASLSSAQQRALIATLGVAARGNPVDALLAHLKGLSEDARAQVLEHLRSATRDPSQGARELLDWSEIDRLARAGIDIESHGASHAILTGIPPAEAFRELRSAREHLRERGHGRHGLLAYPSGAYDAAVRRLAQEAGYTAAFTTEPGLAAAACDPLAFPRVGVHDDVSRTRVEFLRTVPGWR